MSALEQRNLDLSQLDAENMVEFSNEIKNLIGVNSVTFGASADSKVSIAQYETAGIFASMSMTFDLTAFTGQLPVDEIVNKVVMPIRNSFTRFAHPETMSRIEELRAIVEGVRDGKSYTEIERNVAAARQEYLKLMRASFQPKKEK
jgi:hypothetical protein